MNIDWSSRLKNKAFWITFIPTVLLLLQAVGAVFGYTLDFTELSSSVLEVVNVVFVILALLGISVDTSTDGFSDEE